MANADANSLVNRAKDSLQSKCVHAPLLLGSIYFFSVNGTPGYNSVADLRLRLLGYNLTKMSFCIVRLIVQQIGDSFLGHSVISLRIVRHFSAPLATGQYFGGR